MKPVSALTVFLSLSSALLAQGPAGYYRYPAIHSETVIFTAEGDLWRVSLAGGAAQRLTTHPGAETRASISRDGKWVAFSGEYEGPAELYVMPAEGGRPRRLTWETAQPAFTGWTPDGRILFATRLMAGLPDYQLLSIATDGTGLQPVPLSQASDGAWNAQGQTLVFTRFAFQGSSTKRYQGGTAQNLWRWSTGQPEAVPVTPDFPGTSRSPLWWGERVVFLTDRDGIMNLWSMLPDGKELTQHTQHKDYDVKSPAISGNTVVYQLGADLHRLDLTNGQSARIPITLATDADHQREKWVSKPMDYLTAANLSPDGDRVVLTARGQLFVAPVKDGRFVEVSRNAGVRSRYGRFLPDGKSIVALSDASGELEFWQYPANGSGTPQALTSGGTNYRYEGLPSPDGKWILFHDRDRQLLLWSADKKTTAVLAKSPAGEFEGLAWSPDSAWIAWVQPAANTVRQIFIQRVSDNARLTVTSDRVESYSPAWSPDGKWLYFLSDRELRTLVESPWGPRQPEPFFDQVTKIFAVGLTKSERWPFLPADELHRPKKDDDSKKEEKKDEKKEDKASSTEVKVEADGLTTRLYEVPVEAGNYSALSAKGEFLFWVRGETDFKAKRHLQRLKITNEKPKAKNMVEDIKGYDFSADGKKLLVRKENALYVLDASGDADKLDEAKVQLDNWAFSINPRDEWRQMFTDSWRLMRDWFYDAKMHALDWEAVRKKYLPLVDRVADRQELADLMSEMVGELSALHIFVRDGDARSGPDDIDTASLGARLDADPAAGGWKVTHIPKTDPDFPALLAPLAKPEAGVREGDLITAINGQPFSQLPHYGAALRRMDGKQVLLTLKTGADPARETIVRPVPFRAAANLRYSEWEYTRRLKVEADGKGNIGYVHLRAMQEQDMAAWAREFYPVYNRQGLIIDVRHNRGGNIDSWLIGRLLRKAWMYWQPRTGNPEWNMQYAFRGHVCVLCDEFTASDGEAFSEGVKRLGIGKVIGTRTWGGEIWLSFENELADKGIASAAEIGVFGPEGKWLIEGHGVDPDIIVDNLPVSTFKGGDAQLDAALKHLQDLIAKDPRPVPSAPVYPDKRSK
ncbi:MAG TPA: S41 family peptidase [Verrucomicrobiales bacterium]|nr:S41 family peptidase [Verrucomicrobiales bacterium]